MNRHALINLMDGVKHLGWARENASIGADDDARVYLKGFMKIRKEDVISALDCLAPACQDVVWYQIEHAQNQIRSDKDPVNVLRLFGSDIHIHNILVMLYDLLEV